MEFWLGQSESSSNNHVVRRRRGPKQYDSHNVMYTTKPDDAYWADFTQTYPHLVPWIARTTFLKHKPFWLKPHKWLTCKCPMCHEIDCFLKAFVRLSPTWHKGVKPNVRPTAASSRFDDGAAETHCWHCRLSNPLYRNLACPSFITGDLDKQGGSGLDALYRLCVCDHAYHFGPGSSSACASASDMCAHGAGPLLRGHSRTNEEPEKKEEEKEEKEDDVDEDEAAEHIDEGEDLCVRLEAQPAVVARRARQLLQDRATLGVWPIQSGAAACPAYETQSSCKWREYQWVEQSFVDRDGKHQNRKNQVLVEQSGVRQDFLATFKRKLLAWLPHKQHLLWDDFWYQNAFVNEELGCERVRTMQVGDVHVRLDFIKNAELRSPHQAQREFFVSLGLSLLCAVVQWKVADADGKRMLRSRTVMFMSDDRKHDGVFAGWGMDYLVSNVIPTLPGLLDWNQLVLFSDNGPHFAQTYVVLVSLFTLVSVVSVVHAAHAVSQVLYARVMEAAIAEFGQDGALWL